MAERALLRGDVVLAALPGHVPQGHEQQGTRAAVVVGVPSPPMRYPVLVVVPLTAGPGPWADANQGLYPRLPAGAGGLGRASVALCDQVRACDADRLRGRLGTLSPEQLAPIQATLRTVLGL